MRVLLLRNYPFDGSTSMRIFADALSRELRASGITLRELAPNPVFGRIRPGVHGIGKWLGYIDRFLLFPALLRVAAAKVDLVHICDHGSAMYAGMLRKTPVVVTCHDMLAVRGALGEVEDCRPSFFGRFLQRWIVHGLRQARCVACVSQFTRQDTVRILGSDRGVTTVINGLPKRYALLDDEKVTRRLNGIDGLDKPFVLHVGSNLKRKNREAVLRIFAKASERVDLRMVFAGRPLNESLLRMAEELNIKPRVIQVTDPTNETLEAIYNRAVALLFPSRYDGFGWPPIEAQACGCPAVTSNIPPLAEVLGDSAELFPVEDEAGMAEAIVRLATDAGHRDEMRQRGFSNVHARFETSRMIGDYLKLYREVSCQV